MKVLLTFTPDGTGHGIDNDAMKWDQLGVVARIRASHVEPVNRWKRAAFHAVRSMFGERGTVAAWTRAWSGPWRVRWAGDDHPSFTHQSRVACIEWEIDELTRRINQ